jgi:hypothetical protein
VDGDQDLQNEGKAMTRAARASPVGIAIAASTIAPMKLRESMAVLLVIVSHILARRGRGKCGPSREKRAAVDRLDAYRSA